MTAGLTSTERRKIYARDGYRCALCDGTDGIQIHHVIARGAGGTNKPDNLITLCWRCHAEAHGTKLDAGGWLPEDIEQACIEYLADFYAEDGWHPGWFPELERE